MVRNKSTNRFSQLINRETNASRIKLNVYKLFYDFQGDNNPNKGFKCIFDDFYNYSYKNNQVSDILIRFLKLTLKSIKYYKNISNDPNTIRLNYDTSTRILSYLINSYINYNLNNPDDQEGYIDFKEKLNNFYITGDKETIYI